jgi:hypothetical protein
LMCRNTWGPFWTCPWDLPVSLMKPFLVKIHTPSLGTTLLKCQIIRISKLLDTRLDDFAVHIFFSLCLMTTRE